MFDNPIAFVFAVCWPAAVACFATWWLTADVSGKNTARLRASEKWGNAGMALAVAPLFFLFVVMAVTYL